MDALMGAMLLWLSTNFNLPPTVDLPRIEFVSAAKLTSLRYRGLLTSNSLPNALSEQNVREVVSVYDDATRIIYLREGWTGKTPAELSILIHELVHHLQNIGKLKYGCPQEREKLAYAAQEQWLRLFGRDLERDFAIDPMTLLATTGCY